MLKHSPDLMCPPPCVKGRKLGQNQQQRSNEFMVPGIGKIQA